MDKLGAMRMFVRVVESGSFSQAARDLSGAVLAASVAVAIAVMLTGLMMSLRPRPSQQDPESIT